MTESDLDEIVDRNQVFEQQRELILQQNLLRSYKYTDKPYVYDIQGAKDRLKSKMDDVVKNDNFRYNKVKDKYRVEMQNYGLKPMEMQEITT